MDAESQRPQIGASLKAITQILNECHADYRVLGSLLLVGYTGKIFRHINDIDMLLSINARSYVFEKLKQEGFELEKKSKAGFNWIEAKKDNCLGLTFMLVGKFKKKYFAWSFMRIFELRIKASYLKPTEYRFDGITFTGIPIQSAIAGIRQSFLNPKRKLDKEILKDVMNGEKVKIYDNISVYIGGIKLPYLYDAFSFFYNIYGGMRVIFGRKYEIWD